MAGAPAVARPDDPPTVELEPLRLISLVMFSSAIFGLLCAIVGPDPDPSDHLAFAVIIAFQVVPITVIACVPAMTPWLLRAGCWWGVLTILACVAVARPTNGVPLYTMWPLLVAAYGMPRRDFAALLAATPIGLGVVIGAFVPDPAWPQVWLHAVLTVMFATLAVRFLRERIDDLVDGLRDVTRRLQETARRDPLTGLPNRRAFEEALDREIDRAERHGRALALVLFDLDHFKAVNDTRGHAEGDACLRLFADVASGELRPGDVLGRLGGEEFALALFDADAGAARELAERIVGALRAASAGTPTPLTASAGVVERADARTSREALLAVADQALYAAKAAGRRRVAVGGPGASIDVGGEVLATAPCTPPARTAPTPEPSIPDLTRGYDPVDARAASRVAGVQSLAALPTLASAALLPEPSTWDLTALALMGAVLVALGASLLRVGAAPWLVLRLTPYSGVAVVTAAVAVNEPLAGTGFFYLWPAVYAAVFLPRRDLGRLLCATAAAYGAALWLWSDEALRISDFTTVMAPVVVAAAAVAHLRGRVLGLVAELRERLEELREAATHDPLTGLLNRRAFDGLLAREVDRAGAAGLRLSVVMFDMDHFKRINDRFGHAAGDEALRRFAATLRQGRRSDDVAARLGGEEFALVLLGAGPDQAAMVAGAVIARLADAGAEHPAALSVSAGIASLDDDLATPDALLAAADRALYAAKAAGRGQAAIWGRPVRIGASDAAADDPRLSASTA